jgi:hypothetical protein
MCSSIVDYILDDLRLYSDSSPSFLYFGREGECGCPIFRPLTGENLLKYKLIHVQCTQKSTPVPISPVPFAQLETKFRYGSLV